MKRFGLIAFACVLATSGGWAGAAFAGVADSLNEISLGQTELGQIAAEQKTMLENNEAEKKVYDVYAGNQAQLRAQVQQITDNFIAQAKRREAAAQGMVENWNAECDVKRVGPLKEPAYSRCGSLRAEVEKTVNGIEAGIKADAAEVDRTQIAPLAAAMQKQQQAMNDIASRMKARFDRSEALRAREKALRLHLEELRASLAQDCARRATNEDVHLCASVGFDGANGSLPPLDQIRPPFGATPNH